MKKLILLFAFVLIGMLAATSIVISQTTANTYGPIKTGERLWNIAAKVRPARSISHYQAMLALLKANPHAFTIACNLNTLKIGQTLQIPSRAEMEALSHARAVKEFNRQNQEWKAYRRHRQPIVCPPSAQPEKLQLEVTKGALGTATKAATDSSAPDEVQNATDEKNILSFMSSAWEEGQSWLSTTPLPLPRMIGLLAVLVLLLLMLVIGRRRRRKKSATNQSATKKNIMSDDPLEKIPLPANTPAVKTQHDEVKLDNTVSPSASDAPTLTATESVNQKSKEMKEKLDNVRAILSENEAQIVQKMLREVIQKGTPEEQAEAVQLYEMSKKIRYSKQNVKKKQPVAMQPNTSNNPVWQEIEQRSQHLPTQQYLPENREQVFELIDKIFELLDYELNAQGKLIEAYMNRPQHEFFKAPNYEIVEEPEKLVVDEEKDEPLGKPRPEPQPTRYL
jgi:FimV-like protein